MQVLQALFLSSYHQAELITPYEEHRGRPRYRWVVTHISPHMSLSPEQQLVYTLSVHRAHYPQRRAGHGWGDPVYAEAHNSQSFETGTDLLAFIEQMNLPRAWEPVEPNDLSTESVQMPEEQTRGKE